MDTAPDGDEGTKRSLRTSSSSSAAAAAAADADEKGRGGGQQKETEGVATAAAASNGGVHAAKDRGEEEEDDITRFLDSLREDEGVTVEGAVSLPPVIEDDPTYDAPAAFIPVAPTSPQTPQREKKKPAKTKERTAAAKAGKAEGRGATAVAAPGRRTPPTPGKAQAGGKAAKDKAVAGTPKTPSLKMRVPTRPSKDKATGAKRAPAGKQSPVGAEHPAKRAKAAPSPKRRRSAAKSPTKPPTPAGAKKAKAPTGSGVVLPPSTAPSTAAAMAPKVGPAAAKDTLRPVVREEAAIPGDIAAPTTAAREAGKRDSRSQGPQAVAKEKTAASPAAATAGKHKPKEKTAHQTPVKVKVKLSLKQEPQIEKSPSSAAPAAGGASARRKATKPTARPSSSSSSSAAAAAAAATKAEAAPNPSTPKAPAGSAPGAGLTPTVAKAAKGGKAGMAAPSVGRTSGTTQRGGTTPGGRSRASRSSSAASGRAKTMASSAKPPRARASGPADRVPDLPARLKSMSQKEILNRAITLRNRREQEDKEKPQPSLYCTSACKHGTAARSKDDMAYIACDFCDIWYHIKCGNIDDYFLHMPSFICETCAKRLPANRKWLQWVLDRLKSYKFEVERGQRLTGNDVFGYPVETQVPSYRDTIKEPMDLGTMQKKLDAGEYKQYSQFFRDVALIVINCRNFNKDNAFYAGCADALSLMFESIVEVSRDWLKHQWG